MFRRMGDGKSHREMSLLAVGNAHKVAGRVPLMDSQTSSSWLTAHLSRVYLEMGLHHVFLMFATSSTH